MGPSGAGKSTLLGCISGIKRNGLTGSITISTNKKVKFAFVTQDDYLLENLSIVESLTYASRIKNDDSFDHKSIANNIMKKLKIKRCANIRPKHCSGGQKKRVSIALELVSRPNILILDEPTSGLDSVSAYQLIGTLKELAKQSEPLVVVTTIHQPSARLFNRFDSVYIMSYDGQCIYQGSPTSLVSYLGQYDMVCGDYDNPADFVLDIANKRFGIENVMKLSTIESNNNKDIEEFNHKISINANKRFFSNTWILTKRSFTTTYRDIFLVRIRVTLFIVFAVMIGYMYGPDSGQLSGCAIDLHRDKSNYFRNYVSVNVELIENSCCLVFMAMFATFGAIFPNVLVFPKEFNIFLKEYRNGWYSCISYLLSKVICDLPFQLLIPNLASVVMYYMTGQYLRPISRLYLFAIVFILISLCASAQGLLMSAIFYRHPVLAPTLGLIIILPMVLFSGTMARMETMPEVMQRLTVFNYMRFGLESFVVIVYGLDRCDDNPLNTMSNKTDLTDYFSNESLLRLYSSDIVSYKTLLSALGFAMGDTDVLGSDESTVMTFYALNDGSLYRGIAMLFIHYTCLRVITYFVILMQIHLNK